MASMVDTIEDLAFLADAGVGLIEAARRVGAMPTTVEKMLRRERESDLLLRLRANEPAGAYTEWKRNHSTVLAPMTAAHACPAPSRWQRERLKAREEFQRAWPSIRAGLEAARAQVAEVPDWAAKAHRFWIEGAK